MQQNTDQLPLDRLFPIRGAEGYSAELLRQYIRAGYRCVRFQFVVSALIVTFRFESETYITENWQARYLFGLQYSLAAIAFGPWGIPWGPLLTAKTTWINLCGGVDVTDQVLAAVNRKCNLHLVSC